MSINLLQPSPNEDDNDIKLRQLLDYALEHQQEDREQFTTLCEELMIDKSKRLIVNAFGVEGIERRGKLEMIYIEFDCPKVCRIWKACLDAAFCKLKLALSCGHGYNFIECEISNSEDVEKVFGIVLPLVKRTDFESAIFNLVRPVIFDIFSKIFNGKTVRKVDLELENSKDFDAILRFVRVVRPSMVATEQLGDNEYNAEFLLPLSDLVETIDIGYFIDDKEYFLIVKEMLSRKCKHLRVYGDGNVVSLTDVERFIQFFHHLAKPVALRMPTNTSPLNAQVGEYTLKSTGRWGRELLIEHELLKGKRMSVNLLQPSPDEDDNDIKLRQLLGSALEHQKENRDQFTAVCEELMSDRSKQLVVTVLLLEKEYQYAYAEREKILIAIGFGCPKVCAMWKACLDVAFSELKVVPFYYKQKATYIGCNIIKSEDLKRVFEYLKPLIQRSDFEKVLLADVQPIIVDTLSKLFNSKTIREIQLRLDDHVDYDAILRFIHVVRPSIVKADQTGDREDFAQFMLHLADLVETIMTRNKMDFSIVKEMLIRKCKYLYATDLNRTLSTVKDVESLVQFLHGLEKTVALRISTKTERMNCQVGEYTLKNVGFGGTELLIEHQLLNGTYELDFFEM